MCIYQSQTMYRDEARPRAGILRGREFVMKDSYSFDIDDEGLQRSYDRHRAAYIKTFDRLGLNYVIVSAMSGAMGGSASEEFLAPCESGEDTFVRSAGGYAANVEAVVTVPPEQVPIEGQPAAHVEDTPDTPTIETLVAVANELFPDRGYTAADTLKNVVLMLDYPDGSASPLVVGLPGDRDVDMKRLEAQVSPAVPRPFEEDDFKGFPQMVKGYIGPEVLGEERGIRYVVDPRVVTGTAWITGANQPGKHVFDLVCGRDFTADGTIEAAEVRAGDPAPDGSGPLHTERGIEIGHIFQLGRKYAEALDLTVLDENGKSRVVTMGSYGIGVSRAVAAIAEQYHDDKGLIWPREVSPADVHIVATGKDSAVYETAEELAIALEEAGLRVLYDDRRQVSPGVKFNDSELLGVPTIVVVGKRLVDGMVEIKDRATGERQEVAVAEALATLIGICRPIR